MAIDYRSPDPEHAARKRASDASIGFWAELARGAHFGRPIESTEWLAGPVPELQYCETHWRFVIGTIEHDVNPINGLLLGALLTDKAVYRALADVSGPSCAHELVDALYEAAPLCCRVDTLEFFALCQRAKVPGAYRKMVPTTGHVLHARAYGSMMGRVN